MSDPVVEKPAETSAVEAAPAEAPVVETKPVVTEPAVAPEAAILAKDPVVVAANLEKAEPVATEDAPATTTGEGSAPAAETSAEPAPATPEKHKEGQGIVKLLKKWAPNPKQMDKKGKSVASETPAKAEDAPAATTSEPVPEIVEPAKEEPFTKGAIGFKTHGGVFGYIFLIKWTNR